MNNIELQKFLLSEFKELKRDIKEEIQAMKLDISSLRIDITNLKISNVKISTKVAFIIFAISGFTSTVVVLVAKLI